ncbi:mitochondrial 54S ribosomal protein YmL35 [Elasticomyces elasticus]|uniref:Mitochondrial 54S ribosomal protein YmL35 n=1 Tax=Exophiala sideris TaxID=1016849 RepID=A0ABR0JHJ3_9EURO|nr:mitochondrial 54S ribosomal protein YmL35 [Elasticomyces elasticus]KAK5034079.1 mitochondrial 54S ribosomal protein YmL35 [Exophiala sideris]KAK5042375.1 mitochondrial 54S ribosomal protein YmL35 [Exophiala sideris]KAK5065456.1 mitochondrial 54S ribosomal protein YmL35 [Exophiala sideris]KAK5186084.1 mitochondrial 54S ribosomal protein YmL35 [Eurotiomycetes sp. CCFEE 6388]
MPSARAPSALLLHSLRSLNFETPLVGASARSLSTTSSAREEAETQRPSFYRNPDPATVFVPRLERKLSRAGKPPIGSRRRRAALAQSPGIAFDQLPYQCFQEARKILIEDRAEKLKKIETERARIAHLQDVDPSTFPGGEVYKQRRLRSMQAELEQLKILADINDPNVKRRFEDGKGDMNKPIYRYLAERKWREYPRKILVQRITQMNVLPDVIPNCDPILDVKISFGKKAVPPGDFVESHISENPCQLVLQPFDRGEKMVSIAIVDPDVPNIEADSFDTRCHFLASNIIISATQTLVDLAKLSADSQVLLPWLPPHAQKGSPYHRLSIIVLQQKDNIPIDLEIARKKVGRDGFSTRRFMSRHILIPISASLFRTQWDDSTAAVMQRAGLAGGDVELKRKKVEPLPYKRRNPSSFR